MHPKFLFQPLESLFPLVLNPGWNDSTPKLQQFLNKVASEVFQNKAIFA